MKRFAFLFVVFLMGILVLEPCKEILASSASPAKEEIICFEDGSRIIIRTFITSRQEYTDGTRTWNTVSATKQYEYDWPDDEAAWVAEAIGTFIYDGSTVMCVSSGHNNITYSPYWTCQSISHSSTNSSVTTYFTYSSVIAGLTISRSVTLSCSTNGDIY